MSPCCCFASTSTVILVHVVLYSTITIGIHVYHQVQSFSLFFFFPHFSIYAYKSCFSWLNLIMQYSRSIWVVLEGSWLCEASIEEQATVEGGGCWYSSFVWAGVLCLVLCWWNRWKGIYFHWLPCLRKENCC